MKRKTFETRVKNHLASYKRNVLKIEEEGEWRRKKYAYILPQKHLYANFLPSIQTIAEKNSNNLNFQMNQPIVLHHGATHLNSSQVMCLNLFAPYLVNERGREILLSQFSDLLKINFENEKNLCAGFEYCPKKKEQTHFDFYCKISGGYQIFLEAKYTEPKFDRLSKPQYTKEKYQEKWERVYKEHLAESLYLKELEQNSFFEEYQIYRNISYVRTCKDYSIFLFPFESEELYKQITKVITPAHYSNVRILNWPDFYNYNFKNTDRKFEENCEEFEIKYLDYRE